MLLFMDVKHCFPLWGQNLKFVFAYEKYAGPNLEYMKDIWEENAESNIWTCKRGDIGG